MGRGGVFPFLLYFYVFFNSVTSAVLNLNQTSFQTFLSKVSAGKMLCSDGYSFYQLDQKENVTGYLPQLPHSPPDTSLL